MDFTNSKAIISCHLMGGLGNQLFQIFVTMAYSLEHNYTFLFPYSNTLNTGTIRQTYWDNFLLNLKQYTTTNNTVTKELISKFPKYCEKGFSYVKIPRYQNDPHICLFGYYQSYKYFNQYYNDICNIIKLNETQHSLKIEYNYLLQDITVSMHFRLGDYVKIQDCHPLMTESYYDKSINTIIKKIGVNNFTILYFCQDIDNERVEETINNLKCKHSNIIFKKVDDTIDDWKQMMLMSLCNHNIIANSSFSWWGAYFNNNKPIVCYPDLWFGPKLSYNDTKDLFPIEWNKIIC
jgi:hypothetical protein|tara:strand:- start:1007 stop:1882 length:876 start_codon:yes stop_codon:yes gene_type:complete